MEYDWNKYGRPGVARFNRVLGAVLLTEAAWSWIGFGWFAVTRDWTLIFVPVLITVTLVVYRLSMRKVYGVRPPGPVRPRIRQLPGSRFEIKLDPAIFPDKDTT